MSPNNVMHNFDYGRMADVVFSVTPAVVACPAVDLEGSDYSRDEGESGGGDDVDWWCWW